MVAITDYASLVEEVNAWSGGSSDTGFKAAIDSAIRDAEDAMNRALRVPEMVKRVHVPLTQEYENLPADFLKAKAVFATHTINEVTFEIPLAQIMDEGASWGNAPYYRRRWFHRWMPAGYALSGMQIRLSPYPGDDDLDGLGVRIIYYGRVEPVTADMNCTALLANYPALYKYGTLASLSDYTQDDAQMQKWQGKFSALLAQANDNAVFRGGPYG